MQGYLFSKDNLIWLKVRFSKYKKTIKFGGAANIIWYELFQFRKSCFT
jgi:hypothetical protein